MTTQIGIIVGSLLVIFAVTALVRWMRLGEVALENRQQAFDWAERNIPFFTASEAIVSEDGQGALVMDDAGRVVLVKRHGSKFAARLIEAPIDAQQEGPIWCIGSGDRQFGRVRLQFDMAGQQRLLTLL